MTKIKFGKYCLTAMHCFDAACKKHTAMGDFWTKKFSPVGYMLRPRRAILRMCAQKRTVMSAAASQKSPVEKTDKDQLAPCQVPNGVT